MSVQVRAQVRVGVRVRVRRLAPYLELALELACLVPLQQLAWAVALLSQGAPLLDTLDGSGELDGFCRNALGRLELRKLLLVLLRLQLVACLGSG